MRILLIGDEQKTRRLLSLGLGEREPGAYASIGSRDELNRFSQLNEFGVAVLDWEMRSLVASDALAFLSRKAPQLPVIVTTATEEGAAQAREGGAVFCLLKPFDVDALRATCQEHAIESAPVSSSDSIPEAEEVKVSSQSRLSSPRETLKRGAAAKEEALEEQADFSTRSPVMQRMLDVAWRVAPTPASVLILGENGTGKNVLAHAIHARSDRSDKAFVTVHCPCLQEQLLESELFGHVKGSFTGAVSDTTGKVAAAAGGTLFLDEIGDLPLSIQPKLLRLLQERKYERVGETTPRSADIRVIAATNRDLQAEVKAGRFREDLYYRLNVVSVEVLPLRERVEDIVHTAEYFLRNMAVSLSREFRGFSPMACEMLRNYRWPGNVRELRNAVERAAILSDREILDVADFPQLVSTSQMAGPRVGEFVSVSNIVEEHIRLVVSRAASLEHAARILQIDRSTLYRKRKRWQSAAPFPEFTASAAAQSEAG
ncbi:MAG TPA: sigma-54 dependent transcriptional regulator [Opitutaceae bacterium]|nr:sigma-54 dependent transcriptional regulator [Opitutaceae bacterium]